MALNLARDEPTKDNNNNNSSKLQRDRLRVSCKWRQLIRNETTGQSQLIRHRLTGLCEEQQPNDQQGEPATSLATRDQESQDDEDGDDDDDSREPAENDFQLFLRRQHEPGSFSMPESKYGSRVSIVQSVGQEGSHARRKASSKGSRASVAPKPGAKLNCLELFCIHQESLIVHRAQILLESEQLAQKLAELLR